jgi:hypothetical protein
VQVAGLGAVALVDEHEQVALGLEAPGSDFFSSSTKRLMSPADSPSSLPPNLWMSEQISHGARR